jgi:hypothetical protein
VKKRVFQQIHTEQQSQSMINDENWRILPSLILTPQIEKKYLVPGKRGFVFPGLAPEQALI